MAVLPMTLNCTESDTVLAELIALQVKVALSVTTDSVIVKLPSPGMGLNE